MVIPVNTNVHINLTSTDVIHGFYVKAFNFSRYALPGVLNQFTLEAVKTGNFYGQCTQLCGLYHSLMFFNVKVVTQVAVHRVARQHGEPRGLRRRPEDDQSADGHAGSDQAGLEPRGQLMVDLITPPPVVIDDEHRRARGARAPRSHRDPEVDDLDRPQGHRPLLHRHLGRHDAHRWSVRRDHPRPARVAERHAGLARAVQRTVHDARFGDDLPLRRTLRLRRTRQHHRADPDRRAGHGLPASQRALLLAVPHGLDHHVDGLLHRRRRRQLRLGRLRATLELDQHARCRCRPLDRRTAAHGILGDLHRRQSDRHDLLSCARPA